MKVLVTGSRGRVGSEALLQRGASNQKARHELNFRLRPLEFDGTQLLQWHRRGRGVDQDPFGPRASRAALAADLAPHRRPLDHLISSGYWWDAFE